MGKLLFIDSDDVNALSNALQEALQRRGINFNSYGINDEEEDEEDIDPYLGNMPSPPINVHRSYGGCGSGGCGYTVSTYCGSGGC